MPIVLEFSASWLLLCSLTVTFQKFLAWVDAMASFSLEYDGFMEFANSDNGLSDDPFINVGIMASQNRVQKEVLLDPNYSDISDDEKDFEIASSQSHARSVVFILLF